ncbi:MAG: hypothetical protein M1826_007035 [Phylliscum demangeonii]|nr:MAG: hypothetical protein M1826_007035 [Phylliscum demangeonii]
MADHLDPEKVPQPQAHQIEVGQVDEGYVLDSRLYGGAEKLAADGGLKTAADGHTILIPQPTDDVHDPLNWSATRKNIVLAIISATAFVADFGSSIGAVTLLPQAQEWHLSPTTVQHNLVANIIVLGVFGLIIVAFSNYLGRLPVLLFCLTVSIGTAAWCAAATSFNSFLAARIVNGLFSGVTQSGGLMFIQDIFFFHEHPRKINIWSAAIVLSPYLGPFTGAFVIWKTTWRWSFWIVTILTGLCWLAVLLFMDETYYDRGASAAAAATVPVARGSRLGRLLGIEQWRRSRVRGGFVRSVTRPLIAVSKLPVLLCCLYYFVIVAWVIGVNAALAIWLTQFYRFNPKNLGLFYFAGITGAILGQAVGHFLYDLAGRRYVRAHQGRIEPEARLAMTWLSTPLLAVGLVVMSFALQHTWHYMVVAVFWAMQVAGLMIATTSISAYLLDAYPEGSGEVGAWIAVARTLGGFVSIYAEIPWVTGVGMEKALGTQAALTVAAAAIVVFLQFYGKRIRHRQGPMY